MNPERTDYSLSEAALKKAGIDPAICDYDVQTAEEMGIPNSKLAEKYFFELVQLIVDGKIPISVCPDIPLNWETVFWEADQIYISHQEFMGWNYQKQLKSSTGCNPKMTNQETPASSTLIMLGLFIKELGYHEEYNEKGKKGGQYKTIVHTQEIAKKHKVFRNLSRTTIQRNINAALNKIKEISQQDDT